MTATEPALSDDELVVLSIAAEGESMIPIGRWEEPVKRLVTLGYLWSADKFNNLITERGRKRWAAEDDREIDAIIRLNNQMAREKAAERAPTIDQKAEDGDAPGDAGRLQ